MSRFHLEEHPAVLIAAPEKGVPAVSTDKAAPRPWPATLHRLALLFQVEPGPVEAWPAVVRPHPVPV